MVAVGGKTLFYYLPLTIAIQNGYFKAEGLEVELQDFPGGARALQALLGGSVDVTSGAYEHTITQQAKGQNIEADLPAGQVLGDRARDEQGEGREVQVAGGSQGDEDRRDGAGIVDQHVRQHPAREVGDLKPDDVSIIGAGATAGAVAIMQRGELDALANLDPVVAQLESQGFVSVVDTRTAKGMQEVYGGAYAAGSIYVPVDFPKKYPNTTQAFVNAMMRALRFIQHSTPDQIVAAVPTDYYADKALYKAALEKNLESFQHDGAIGIEAARNVYRDLKTFDPQVQTATVDLNKTFDSSFALKAAQKFK